MPLKKTKGAGKRGRKKKNTKLGEPMPSLIFNSAQLPPAEEQDKAPERPAFGATDEAVQRQAYAKKIMMIGVIAVSSIILFMWGWSLKLRLSTFAWQKTPESQLAANAKQNWDELFAETKNKEQTEAAKKQLKEIISQLFIPKQNIETTGTASTTVATTSVESAAIASTTP